MYLTFAIYQKKEERVASRLSLEATLRTSLQLRYLSPFGVKDLIMDKTVRKIPSFISGKDWVERLLIPAHQSP